MDSQYARYYNNFINESYILTFNMSFHLLEVDISEIISSLPLIDLFQNITRKTSFGWDQVTQSLVQLGIILMDLAVPSAPWGKVSGENTVYMMNFVMTIEFTNKVVSRYNKEQKGNVNHDKYD